MNNPMPAFANFKFENGQTVKDRVTGFKGVILGRTQYATGCIQYGICPPGAKRREISRLAVA